MDVDELVPGKETCIPTMHFERLLVTEKCIELYINKEYFPEGVARVPKGEVILKPEYREAVVFKFFFPAGLRFPCDPALPAFLDWYKFF